MSFPVQLLHGRVVGVLVRDEEGSLGRASVGVVATILEDALVHDDVIVVDSIVEGDGDHLGHGVRLQLAWDLSAVRGAIAIGQHALGLVARGRAVGIAVHG